MLKKVLSQAPRGYGPRRRWMTVGEFSHAPHRPTQRQLTAHGSR